MIFVCEKHVKTAIDMLKAPHVDKLTNPFKCSICQENAVYKIYYYDYITWINKNGSCAKTSNKDIKLAYPAQVQKPI